MRVRMLQAGVLLMGAATGPASWRLRAAAPGDLAAVIGLLERAGLPVVGVAEAFGAFVVAEAEGAVVAAGGLELAGGDALLRSMVVDPAWRGRALGQALTARLLADASARGLDTLWLLTTTAADFFPRFGFRRVARSAAPPAIAATAEFAGACCATAIPMARRVRPLRVLMVCTANVARSQLAEALLRHRGGDLVHVASAGAAPGRGPHPDAVAVLAERGIAWQGKRSKGLDEVGRDWDLVITLCDDARDSCPVLPGLATLHWGLPDPTFAPGGAEARTAAFRATADLLTARFDALLALPLAGMKVEEIVEIV